jgi:hypothetical protein
MGKESEMVAKNKATTGKGQVKKLKLKKETIQDLDVRNKGKQIKGGARAVTKGGTVIGPCFGCGS